MAVIALQSGAVAVFDYRCDAKRGEKPFVEVHPGMSVSYVRTGSFGYKSRGKSYELVAGSVLIGNAGDEFTCTHDYAHGDECLSFHLPPAIAQEIGSEAFWRTGCVPPAGDVVIFGELAQAAAEGRSAIALDEAGLLFAQRAAAAVSGKRGYGRVTDRDRKRAVETAHWIDANCERDIDLRAAAAQAGLSPFHFLRVFTRVAGVTPHQYLLRSRLRRAARLLAASDGMVTDVAFACGYNDLANFTRAFGRAAGRSPAAFRNFCKA
jgi:AraC-like DNA-binding protein